jgi:hypothetical protein
MDSIGFDVATKSPLNGKLKGRILVTWQRYCKYLANQIRWNRDRLRPQALHYHISQYHQILISPLFIRTGR